jgi:hypothetical protein
VASRPARTRHVADGKEEKAKAALGEAMGKLAYVRDQLQQMETGDFNGMNPEDYAFFIGAGFEKACAQLEHALVDLGVFKAGQDVFTEPLALFESTARTPKARHS